MERIRLGLLGGGQLARMSAYYAYRLGIEVNIMEKKANSPAGQIAHREFVGWVDDDKLLEEFAAACDIVSLENEFIDAERLHKLESYGVKVLPSPDTIGKIQDKLIQKTTLKNYGLPVPEFVDASDNTDYNTISSALGNSFILKSRKMGYDGYGNAFVKSEKEFNEASEKLGQRHHSLLAEEIIDFSKELAVMVVRTEKEIKTYPVVETIQKNHICHTCIAPADIDVAVAEEAKKIAVECVKAVDGIGLFGVELFLTRDNKILVNEMAPRPHNSGHYTMDSCITPQFENHVRAVLGWGIGDTGMYVPSAVMVNLLGKREGPGVPENYPEIFEEPGVHLHIYGKDKSRVGRKMGHITLTGENPALVYKKATEIESKIIL